MSEPCGAPRKSDGEPCQNDAGSCPYHESGPSRDYARGLTGKQRRFVEEYTADFNATQAAIRAGYSENTASQIGYQLLQNDLVSSAVEKRLDEMAMTADEALKRLADWGRGDIGDVIEIHEGGSWTLDLEEARKQGKLHLIKEISYDSEGRPKVKLHDQMDAVEKIAKAHGLFKQRIEHSGPEGGPIEVDVDDARERLARQLDEIMERRAQVSGAHGNGGS